MSALLVTGALGPVPAVADTPSPTPSQPSQSTSYELDKSKFSMLVSPTRLTLAGPDLGTAQVFSVVNRGQSALDVEVEKRNFTANPDGSLTYQDDAPYGAADWVSVSPASMRIKPGDTALVTATVRVPEKPEPGDHDLALVFMVPAGATAANIKINRGVGVPVYLTVPGTADSTVTLDSMDAPAFARRGPVPITATLRNVGTVHRDFRRPSPLTVQAAGTAEPFPDFTIPRGASRDVQTTWDPPLLCLCHVTVEFANPGGQAQTASFRVVVFPWDLLAGLVAALLIAFLLTRILRRRYRAQVANAAAKQVTAGKDS